MATERDMEKLWELLRDLLNRPKSSETNTEIAKVLRAIRTGMVQEMEIADQHVFQESIDDKGDDS